jgi:release factor glutamine methyltransferase
VSAGAPEPRGRPLRGVSVSDALQSATVPLRAAGIETARLDAELLLADALGVAREELVTDPDRPLDGPATRRFQTAMRRRVFDREPVAYILGRKGFRGLELHVDARVLVPRPETEHLVEAALGLPPGARVVDVGTGSGAVALALKDERPDLDLIATDVDEDALAVARENAARLGLQVEFRTGDLLDALGREPSARPSAPPRVDAVLSNPPYVATGERLSREVGHEPQRALFGGLDGLEVIRALIPQAAAAAPFVAVEVGEGQAAAVAALMRDAGLPRIETANDLSGIERVVVGRR